ncbi:hypothetical protein C2G38_2319654 [Gigaspora rosea]|uniref:Uncharacterized protein n=1 Tax=Gigaspora rosea TaxID=44941 RepID=A0A397V5Z1_9GLOM|nr:hypothetical protein C2G38_2319654 [Gigaspora rosea]
MDIFTDSVTFSQGVEIITDVLYKREQNKLPTIWDFEEFRTVMESKDQRLKSFFDELYLSTNPRRKSVSTMEKVSKQLVFLCYFICGIRNMFVNNAKRDLGMYLDSTGTPNSTIDTLATMGLTLTSRSISYHKDSVSQKHSATVETSLEDSYNNALLLNIDDYHSIHTIKMPITTTTSAPVHLATILLNPIKTQPAIPRQDIHNLTLVNSQLVVTGIENYFMPVYSLSHNRRWGFRSVDDETKLEELTVHSYDVRLKEKRSSRSLKDTVLVDLFESNLRTMDAYIKAINIAASVPAINKYIEDGNVIPVIADWPGQIHLRTAISRFLVNGSSSGITNKILSFLPMIGPLHISLNSRELILFQYQPFFSEMYKYIFDKEKNLPQKPKPWRINLLLELSRSAWQEIAKMVEIKFGYMCKDPEYLTLKDLLDNTIPLVLDIYAVFFRAGDFNSYLESCFRVWVIFLKFNRKNYSKAPLMFLSDIFHWQSKNHPILSIMKAELPKFSDTPVEIFHSLLRRNTEKHHTAEQIIKEGRYINYLRFNDDGFKENFIHNSTWAVYQYSSRNIETLTRKTACFLLDCFSEIYIRIKRKNLQFTIPPQVALVRPIKRKKKESDTNTKSISIPAMKMKEAWLCHFPLGYSSSYKPSSSGCDSYSCITNTFVNEGPGQPLTEETGRVLPCGHAYHDTCFIQDGSKCLHCFDYIKDGVDKNVQSLLERICQYNSSLG